MATIEIDQETYSLLSRAADRQKVSVSTLVTPTLKNIAQKELTPEERAAAFDELLAAADARADRYPPGFVLDDSRESIYEGCGE